MRLHTLLFNAAPADGGDNPPQTASQINAPQTGQVQLPAEPPDPPPASRIIVEAQRTEREIELEAEREELRRKYEAEASARRKAETDAAYHADEARRLKDLQGQVINTPAAKKKKVGVGWFETDEEEGA